MHHGFLKRALLAVLLSLPALAQAEPEAIAWAQQDLDGTLAEAAMCDAQVLVDIYASWCVPCQRLDSEVFPDPRVRQAAAGMLAVKVDAEVGVGPTLARRYHVVGYPTVLVLNGQGIEVDRIYGFLPAAQFAEALRRIRFGPDTITEVMAPFFRLTSSESVVEEAWQRGARAAVCGTYELADTLLQGVVQADAENRLGFAAQALLALGKYRYLRGAGDTERAIETLTNLIERFPRTDEAAEAMVYLAAAYHHAGNQDEAVAVIQRYIQGSPRDGSRASNAAAMMLREGMDLEIAEAFVREGITRDASDHSLWAAFSEVLFAQGKVDDASQAIGRALAIAPGSDHYRRLQERYSAP